MTPKFLVFVLVALLTQICVGDEIAAYCDIVRMINPDTDCLETVSCSKGNLKLEGVVGSCKSGHIFTLQVNGKELTSLPESLNNMTYLKSLNVAENKLTALPVLDKLTALTTVFIHSNKITNFTGVFVNSPSLSYVSAGNNELVTLPPELSQLGLNFLLVSNNNLTSIPKEYLALKKFSALDISENDLDCDLIRLEFAGTDFATECLAPQQKTDRKYPALPLDYPGDPVKAGLDGCEIAAIVIAALAVVLCVVLIILYVVYRSKSVAE